MEMELTESHSSPINDKGPTVSESSSPPKNDKRPGLFNRQRTSKDESVIARFGKRQQLRRGFGLISAISLITTLTITWEVVTSILLNGLQNGGPAGLVYGYLFVWVGASLQVLVMAEMGSMIPLAGGPFNWVSILAPPWCRNFLSYLAGWLTVITWQAIVAATAYVTGTLVQGLLILNYPTYDYQRWHGTLLFYAALAFALFVNTYLGRLLPQIESLMLLFHIMGFFGLLIPLIYLAPHQPASQVFSNFQNVGGWSTTGLSFFVGLTTCSGSFTGLDAADHIAEEIQNAPTVIPLSMGVSTLLNGTLGFAMLLALLFCMPSDINSVLSSNTYYPFMNIYAYAVGSISGASAMICIIIITQFFSLVGILLTASRMLWAFAREGGLPFSGLIARVDQRTSLPLWAIGATTVLNLLLALINIGSAVGFDAFISLVVAGYYSSFILAAGVMLHKRLTTPNDRLPWGPFRLGRAGVPVTVLAILFSVVVGFFSMWPPFVRPTPEEMNYCVLLWGASLLFSMGFWVAYGRRHYAGPVLEVLS